MKTTCYFAVSLYLFGFFINGISAQTITCPPNVTVETTLLSCNGNYIYSIDFTNGALSQTAGLPSGDFPWGVTVNQFVVTNTAGNSATCSFTVTVRDKTKPICVPPPDVTVSCKNFDFDLSEYGMQTSQDNCCLDTVTTSEDWSQFDSTCHRGIVSRIFLASDCSGNSSECTQRIQVDYAQDYFIRFPDDVIVTACPNGWNFGIPVFSGTDCAMLSVTYEDQEWGLPVDGCAKFERTWTIIDLCTYDPGSPFLYVPNPTVSAVLFDTANLPGPTVSSCDAASPWNPTISKINPMDTVATNYCTFWSPNPNGYSYKQIIRILDNTPPMVLNCPATPLIFADSTHNEAALWHNVFDPNQPSQDLTEAETDLSISGIDDCTGTTLNIEYELFLDLDGDGLQETVVKSARFGTLGNLAWNNVFYGNVSGVGQPRQFDDRPVSANQKWGFAIQNTVSGDHKIASVKFNTMQAQNTYVTPQLPQGTHRIKWTVQDACGNETTCEYVFTIQQGPDNVPPTINCPPDATVETTPTSCTGAYFYAVDLNYGTLDQTSGFPSGDFPLGLTVNQFLVTDSIGNTASCSFTVTVEDKSPPICTPPPNVSVTCAQFDPTFAMHGMATATDNCCFDTIRTAVDWSQFDSLCPQGAIIRTFQAFDCSGNSSQCSQHIQVNYTQDYYIHFPDDVFLTYCPAGLSFGEPTFFGQQCELLGVSYEDEIIDVVPDACYKIERNWKIINWCQFDPSLPLINVPNPNPSPILNNASNLPGPIVSACGTPAPWNPTVVKISPIDTVATNYCTFWNPNANGYAYHQTIKVSDYQDPVVLNCPSAQTTFSDTTQNDPTLWHNVLNPSFPTNDLTEVETDFSITSMDGCSGGYLNVEFLLYMDLDNDGNFETVLQSTHLPAGDTVYYNNFNTPGYLGGTPVVFDSRPVPENQKWHFALQNSTGPTESVASVRWNTALEPGTFVVPQLPPGLYRIRWSVYDNCGNATVCDYYYFLEQGTSGLKPLENETFALLQNEPNPFGQSTTIGFQLPNAAEAILSVYDAAGRPLYSKTGYFGQGYNAVQIEGDWLKSPGVLYYKLESGAKVAWRKMVLIR